MMLISLHQKCYHAVSFGTEIVDAPIQGYGSTEAGGISLMIHREECTRIGSAGRISENVEVKIVDHVTGKPLSVGQRGELFVRGPAVMTGNQRQIAAAIHLTSGSVSE
jgi:long-subunit acyl-CoA synthetase (AMP-forming)